MCWQRKMIKSISFRAAKGTKIKNEYPINLKIGSRSGKLSGPIFTALFLGAIVQRFQPISTAVQDSRCTIALAAQES